MTYAARCTVSIVDTNISSTGETEYFAFNSGNEVIQKDECPKNDLRVDIVNGDTNDRATVGVAIGVTTSIIALISVAVITILCILKRQKTRMEELRREKELQSSTVKNQPQDTSNDEPHFGSSRKNSLPSINKDDDFVLGKLSLRFPEMVSFLH